MELKDFFRENPRVALGFSGGADSSYLLCAALQNGAEVGAYYVKTAFQPAFELEDAKRLAEGLGAALRVIEHEVLSVPEVRINPQDRCYHCKQAIFGLIVKHARRDGWPVVIDGTNASDDASDRPGMRALRELSVRSPLRECGITKEELRRLSKEAGLFTWDKPAYSCLATRVPAGEIITPEKLARIERGEAALFKLGFSDLRLRLRGGGARLELPAGQLDRAGEMREEILAALDGFEGVELAVRKS